jgi:hypothetical protein
VGGIAAEVGTRELGACASAIGRGVRECRARYEITYRGRPVGVMLPLDEVVLRDRVGNVVFARFPSEAL